MSRMRNVAVLAGLAGGGLAPRTAQAVDRDVCLYFDVGDAWLDASPTAVGGNDLREEYGRNDGPTSYPAQRFLARITNNKSGAVAFGWAPLDGNGCATIDVPKVSPPLLTIEWMRWSHWESNGNQVVSYDCDPAMVTCLLPVQSRSFSPSTSGETEVIVEYGSIGDQELRRDNIAWATSFAEERITSLGQNPLSDVRTYATYDQQDVLPGSSNQNDRNFGNQPGFSIINDAYRVKWTIAHEYGHVKTINGHHPFMPSDINYCYDPTTYPNVVSCSAGHNLETVEWSGTAMLEGIANWFALAVWHDISIAGGSNADRRYIKINSSGSPPVFLPQVYATSRPGGSLCSNSNPAFALNCPAGTSNEWDWLSLFQELWEANVPMETILRGLEAHYGAGVWVAADDSDQFFTQLDLSMQTHLTPTEYSSWSTLTSTWNVDQ